MGPAVNRGEPWRTRVIVPKSEFWLGQLETSMSEIR